MSENSSEQRAAQLLQDVIEDAYLDQLEAELDQEHPVDSETFLENLTTGRLSAAELAAFREHQRSCLFCSEVAASLQDRCRIPWLSNEESETPISVPASADTTAAVMATGPGVAAPSDGGSAATLERAREQFASGERVGIQRPRAAIGRFFALAAAIVAVLLLALPGIRYYFRPAQLNSAFTTAALLSDYGLSKTTNSRDFSPVEVDERQAEVFRARLQAAAEDPVAVLNIAAEQLRNRQFDESRELIESVLRQRPEDPVVLNALGLVQTAMNESQTAADTFRRALATRPLFAPAALNLADLLLKQGQRDAARQVLSEVLPDAATAFDKQQLQRRLEALSGELQK
jgi:Tfp pilus assembly protein PilF